MQSLEIQEPRLFKESILPEHLRVKFESNTHGDLIRSKFYY